MWNQIIELSKFREAPWFLSGDFNDIINNEEKKGGPQRAEGSFTDFRSFLSEGDLYDLRHSGDYLSWRGVRNSHVVRCRLDRALANNTWAELFPTGRCEYMRYEGSDHKPILTYLEPERRKSKGIFRFDRRLRDNPEVKNLIEQEWKKDYEQTIDNRLNRVRWAIIQWNKEQNRNSRTQIEKLKRALEEAMVSPQNKEQLISSINKELQKAYRAEEEFWRQRSRILWLSLGDKNSSYFHATTRGRHAVNKFSVIEDEEGTTVFREEQITDVISTFYQKLFISQGGNSENTVREALQQKVSEEENQRLTAEPTDKEIKHATFSIHPDKAPGPDSFSASFFHANWSTIGPAICQEIKAFFLSGVLPKNINETHVRLIPKVHGPKKVSDYRPIALCSVFYKIISKILTHRLKPILGHLVSENQSAFVPDRAIADNVLITHEVLHFLKSSAAKRHCSMAVKTDMSKAYDRLEWEFIKLVFQRLGFHPTWVNWIMQCVTTVSYAYLINGSPKGKVKPQRGIRQGDPLSPYIFILCSEVLSGLCMKAQDEGSLQGIRVAKGSPQINHLLFADDTMFFLRTNKRSMDALKKILLKYELASVM